MIERDHQLPPQMLHFFAPGADCATLAKMYKTSGRRPISKLDLTSGTLFVSPQEGGRGNKKRRKTKADARGEE